MERLSDIVQKMYHKYLPIVQKFGITLDLDFPDTTLTIRERERVERSLDKTLRSAVSRSKNGHISITVRPGRIIITDDGTTLSPATRELLSSKHVTVKSRVGFGTSVEIK